MESTHVGEYYTVVVIAKEQGQHGAAKFKFEALSFRATIQQ